MDITSNTIDQLSKQLLDQLGQHSNDVGIKYSYYNADNPTKPIGISLPVKMQSLKPGVGWASRAITTLSDRLNFDGFINDSYNMNAYFDRIGAFDIIDGLIMDTMVAGCAFAIFDKDQNSDDYNIIPFTAREATAIVDQKTGLVTSGLAVTKWSESPNGYINAKFIGMTPRNWVVVTPYMTAVYIDGRLSQAIPNVTGRTFMQVFTRRRNISRPLGRSRISKTVREIVDEMARVKQRQEVAEEFYSTPQRYINGLANGAKKDKNVDLAIGKMMTISKDEDGDKPDIGQLAQMSISGFAESKKDLARDFCAETGLTLRNLGYETANPTSAESLRTMSDDLLLEAQGCQKELGKQIKQMAVTLRMASDANSHMPESMNQLTPTWSPLFQADVGAMGDAAYKVLQVMPELANTPMIYNMLGISPREMEQLRRQNSNKRPGFVADANQIGNNKPTTPAKQEETTDA